MPLVEGLPRDIRTRRKRRGPRMNCRVPVTIEWNGRAPAPETRAGALHFEAGFTRVVNCYGCLLVSPKEIGLQQKLRLTNLATHRSADGVVVWKGLERPDGWDLGIELVAAELDFWGVDL
jgi:hypothetical protein